MTENKRYIIKGTDDFFLHIEDTTFTEDKHEGSIYNIYQVVDRLNEQDIEIKRLKEELFEARKDYIVDTADISDKTYLDEMIEEERKEIYGDVE